MLFKRKNIKNNLFSETEIENMIKEIKDMSVGFEVQYSDEMRDENNKIYSFDVLFDKSTSLRLDIDHDFIEMELFASWEYRKNDIFQKHEDELNKIEQLFQNYFNKKKYKYEFESFKD